MYYGSRHGICATVNLPRNGEYNFKSAPKISSNLLPHNAYSAFPPGLAGQQCFSMQTHSTIAPVVAHSATTSHGGTCHMKSNKKATTARAKSWALEIPAVQPG
jgi:hypothetical protein